MTLPESKPQDTASGWRFWCINDTDDGLVLMSPYWPEHALGITWPQRDFKARCYKSRKHRAPAPDCVCGVYAVANPAKS